MDVLRETADKVGKYEATIESYKRKLEELSDLKRQCKILEEKNAGYLQINMELEEELKRQGAWKSQVITKLLLFNCLQTVLGWAGLLRY